MKVICMKEKNINLKNLHTKQLLQQLNFTRKCYLEEWERDDYWYETCGTCNRRVYINMLKEELSKRPHILNKKEGKEKRKLMAKKKE